MFFASHNRTGSAAIDKNGNYVMNDAPIGDGLFAPAGGEMEVATLHLPRCRPEEEVCPI